MVKKTVKTRKVKKTAPRKKRKSATVHVHTSSPVHSRGEVHLERAVIENFVALQKVMTNLSLKFDNLSSQISKLLELFEISAKNLAQKDFSLEKENKNEKEIISKLENLADQNKVIARGLTLLHETNNPSGEQKKENTTAQDLRVSDIRNSRDPGAINKKASIDMSEYQKSLSPEKDNESQKP